MRKIHLTVKILSIFLFLGFTILSCENEDSVGFGLLNSGEAEGNEYLMPVVAYNLYNGDTIRSDRARLFSAIVGVFDEPVFGKVKSSYVTQVRMPLAGFNFSDSIENGLPKASVDSAVLYFTPNFSQSSSVISVDTLFTDENGTAYDQNSSDGVDTFRIITKYPITNKYGQETANMTLNVHTINEFLYSIDSVFYSNRQITNELLLGSTTLSDFLVGVQYRNSQGQQLDSVAGANITDVSPSVRIPLDISYFQNNIINKQGTVDLSDQFHFIRMMKGIKISVEEDNGFMVNISPNNLSMTLYYNFTNKKDEDGNVLEARSIYDFDLENVYNVRLGLIERNSSLNSNLSPFITSTNIGGDDKLFLDGLGGFKSMIQIDQNKIDELKTQVYNENWNIVGASLKFHPDPLSDNLERPTTLFAYIYKDENGLPENIEDIDYSLIEFFPDIEVFSSQVGYSFNPLFDSEKNYYEIKLTQYLKDIVENNETNYPIIVEMGDFVYNDFRQPLGVLLTNKPFNPFRMVFKGSNLPGDDERLQLHVLYTDN